MEVTWLIGGLILGTVFTWLITQSRFKSYRSQSQQQLLQLQTSLTIEEERKANIQAELAQLKPELKEEREKALTLSNKLARLESEYINQEKRLAEQKEEVEKLNQKFAIEFKNLANEIFEEKSKKFTDQNKLNLGELLNPLKERINEFQKKVEDTNKESIERNSSLAQQILHLSDLNRQITREAENLTKALKGESKTQGNWGEVILERILEKSGLEKGREYETQVSETDSSGKRFQPDVVVRLPEDKNIIVDSKVSLLAYERFCNGDECDQELNLRQHITSVRAHVKNLSDKNYQSLYGLQGLDFVLLFIPVEPAFTLAAQNDPELFNDAYSRNIVVVSPSTLIATLRTIASIWKQEYQSKNALEIARQGGDLYDKFVSFTEDLAAVGRHLDNSQKAFEDSMKKLKEGKGNLVRRAERIKELGAKTSKNLDQKLLDSSDE